MTEDFALQCAWTSTQDTIPEVRHTAAQLTIRLGQMVVTRHEDGWSSTVRDAARLSAYPLALWIAASWWRLRWEPLPIGQRPALAWRMAHEMGAAGYGSLWPQLCFAGDGESMHIWARQSPPDTADLCALVHLPVTQAFDIPPASGPRSSLSLAIRHDDGRQMRFLLRKRNKPGRRFELARLLGDALHADGSNRWLPATDAKTARQKMQRAFAIEFLCPIEHLQAYLANDFSSDATEDAAEYFGVSPTAVTSHLANHGLQTADVLREDDHDDAFPYKVHPRAA